VHPVVLNLFQDPVSSRLAGGELALKQVQGDVMMAA
jgi:hypothetical protein